MGDDKPTPTEKAPVKVAATTTTATSSKPVEQAPEEVKETPAQPEKKFEGKGLAGVVKKLSEEKLEDKAKRITEKLEKNPDKKDKVVEKEKRPVAKKTATKEDKPTAKATAPKKTTKK